MSDPLLMLLGFSAGPAALAVLLWVIVQISHLRNRVEALEKQATADRLRRIHEADAAHRQGRHPR